MNSACCQKACAEISMTKLPNELVTISFALILSSIINFLSQRRLQLYRSLAARISAFHLTIIPRIKGRPRCANAQACVHAGKMCTSKDLNLIHWHITYNQVYTVDVCKDSRHTNARAFFQQKQMRPIDNHHLQHLDTSGFSAGSLNKQNVETVFTVSWVTSWTRSQIQLD